MSIDSSCTVSASPASSRIAPIAAAFAFVGLAGCGHLGFERGDAGLGSDDASDSGGLGDGDSANPLPPFGAATPLATLNTSFEEASPTLTDDLREICFVSNRNGQGLDVYCSQRTAASEPWPAATRVDNVSSADVELAVGLSGDGLTMYVARELVSAATDIYVATRIDRTAAWSPPVIIAELATMNDLDSEPQPSRDHLELWYARAVPLMLRQPYRASRSATSAAWSEGSLVAGLADSSGFLDSPSPAGNGDVYLVKDYNLVWAPRIDATTYGPLQRLDELNTAEQERSVWISSDARTIVFARASSSSQADLYEAVR